MTTLTPVSPEQKLLDALSELSTELQEIEQEWKDSKKRWMAELKSQDEKLGALHDGILQAWKSNATIRRDQLKEAE